MKWVCIVRMWSKQSRIEKSFSYSVSYSYSNLKSPIGRAWKRAKIKNINFRLTSLTQKHLCSFSKTNYGEPRSVLRERGARSASRERTGSFPISRENLLVRHGYQATTWRRSVDRKSVSQNDAEITYSQTKSFKKAMLNCNDFWT